MSLACRPLDFRSLYTTITRPLTVTVTADHPQGSLTESCCKMSDVIPGTSAHVHKTTSRCSARRAGSRGAVFERPNSVRMDVDVRSAHALNPRSSVMVYPLRRLALYDQQQHPCERLQRLGFWQLVGLEMSRNRCFR